MRPAFVHSKVFPLPRRARLPDIPSPSLYQHGCCRSCCFRSGSGRYRRHLISGRSCSQMVAVVGLGHVGKMCGSDRIHQRTEQRPIDVRQFINVELQATTQATICVVTVPNSNADDRCLCCCRYCCHYRDCKIVSLECSDRITPCVVDIKNCCCCDHRNSVMVVLAVLFFFNSTKLVQKGLGATQKKSCSSRTLFTYYKYLDESSQTYF
jgi:hypothetical protein